MNVTVIILTLNEEAHIRRCIENVRPWAKDIFIVDCFSCDRTRTEALGYEGLPVAERKGLGGTDEIIHRPVGAENLGGTVTFIQHQWPGNQAEQINWALDHLPIRTEWVLRLDADEYLCAELVEEIKAKLETLPKDVTGVVFKRRHIFLGRWIKRGTYPVKLLRLFRFGKARCERRLMDEHIELLEGRAVEFDNDFVDHNLNDIGWWTIKHNGYALREAVELLDGEYGLSKTLEELEQGAGHGVKARMSRRSVKRIYSRLPLFWRAFAYFGVRYILKGGFLEGREGFLWHFLQGWWYRTLIDVKVWEIRRECGGDREKLLTILRDKYGMRM